MNTAITTKTFQEVAMTLAKYYYNILDNLNSHTDIVNSMENVTKSHFNKNSQLSN